MKAELRAKRRHVVRDTKRVEMPKPKKRSRGRPVRAA